MNDHFTRVRKLFSDHEALCARPNEPLPDGNGIYTRFRYPVLTAAHAPVFWRYDLDPTTNPHLMERQGVNAAFNSGAMEWDGKIVLMVRTEGVDRKSFFAIAESESGIDGFRFDLMALLDLDSMKEMERELRALRPDIALYGEPWAGGGPSTARIPTNKQTIGGTHLGAFNDGMRNALVGSPFDRAHGGFVQAGKDRAALQRAIQGAWRDWGDGPHQVIQYMSCHDNYVVYDKIKESKPGATHAEIIEMMKLGYLALFTAQGVPFIHGGEEFARTKQGHENSYNAPDDINQVDWSLKQQNRVLFDYVRDLIALRKAHPDRKSTRLNSSHRT